MKIENIDFKRLSRDRKIDPLHLAREFVQLEVLRRLSESPLKRSLCFKGGTALHLVFNMDRYSEDLDFSLTTPTDPKTILSSALQALAGEEITDHAIKRKTVLIELKQSFLPQNFRVKVEINTDNIVPGELKTLYSEFVPASFTLQIMRTDYLIAQKIRAFLERGKGRDFYDLWFILRTKLNIDRRLLSQQTKIPENDVFTIIESRVSQFSEKQLVADLNPFVKAPLREWVREGLKKDTLQLIRSKI